MLLLSVLALPVLAAGPLQPRAPLPPVDLVVPALEGHAAEARVELQLKFADDARARARGGALVFEGAACAEAVALGAAAGVVWRPLIALPEGRLTELQARAEARTGRQAADLAGLLVAETALQGEELRGLGQSLQGLACVESAQLVATLPPPPADLAPPTPDYTDEQGYLDADPGIDAFFAHDLGTTGALLQLSDCEYGWDAEHEDLVDRVITLEPGQTVRSEVASYGWDDHGTAVLGETSGVDNGYGVTGGAHGAAVSTFPEWTEEEGSRRVTAITNAIAGSLAGDVVLLEMQAGGCDGKYAPAETNSAVFTVVQTGVAAGVVVVGAAGNGAADLDSGCYAEGYVTWGDSGAILVGAGTADTNHDRLSFSTYGSRVDLQGWGTAVYTLGYSNPLGASPATHQEYTSSFGGTSSASPIVASAALLVQDYALAATGSPLDPLVLRNLLVDTGVPQGAGGAIGPLPDVAAAIQVMDGDLDGDLHVDWGGMDCDDADPMSFSGNAETWYDGIDGDCLGGDDFDADGDGEQAAAHGGADCDDEDPAVRPGAEDLWYDGVDSDCGGEDDYDADGDGARAEAHGGADCDDEDPERGPESVDVPGNGVDEDCDGADAEVEDESGPGDDEEAALTEETGEAVDGGGGGKPSTCAAAPGTVGLLGALLGLVGVGWRRR